MELVDECLKCLFSAGARRACSRGVIGSMICAYPGRSTGSNPVGGGGGAIFPSCCHDSRPKLGGAVANRLRRRTSDQTVLGSNLAVAAALSPWTRLFTPIVPRRSIHISFY